MKFTDSKWVYHCPQCGAEYNSAAAAKQCSARPIEHDLGAKVGDWVVVLEGPHKGLQARVERVRILPKRRNLWGADKYWHTVALDVAIPKSEDKLHGAHYALLTFEEYGVRR